jgi:signal recognition particle subunit SRP54
MGDVLTLIEKAQQQFDEREAAKAAEKMLTASFDLEDFLSQMRQIKKMGPLNELLALIPGLKDVTKQISPEMTERQFKRVEAMICSMTPAERRNPSILNASRKRRIAKGSGTTVQELNQLLTQFREAQRMMKQLANNPRLRMMSGLMGISKKR